MVTYQTWTRIAFEVAKQKGAPTGQEVSRDIVSLAAEVWNDRKRELSDATQSRARNIAQAEISIR